MSPAIDDPQARVYFLFFALLAVQFADTHDLAENLSVEAHGLGLGVGLFHVVGDRLLFFLKLLDARDELAQLLLRCLRQRLRRSDRFRSTKIGHVPHPYRFENRIVEKD